MRYFDSLSLNMFTGFESRDLLKPHIFETALEEKVRY